MLNGYYECDQEAVEQVLKSPLFKFMENDVSNDCFISSCFSLVCDFQVVCVSRLILVLLCYNIFNLNG